jgi:hypothetical protein
VFSVTSPAAERRYARKFSLLLERGEGEGEESNLRCVGSGSGSKRRTIPHLNPLLSKGRGETDAKQIRCRDARAGSPGSLCFRPAEIRVSYARLLCLLCRARCGFSLADARSSAFSWPLWRLFLCSSVPQTVVCVLPLKSPSFPVSSLRGQGLTISFPCSRSFFSCARSIGSAPASRGRMRLPG